MENTSPLQVIEGLFLSHPSRGLLVQTHGGDILSIPQVFADSLGKEVSLVLHYAPPSPPIHGLPGLGGCVYLTSCQIHKQDPEYLFSLTCEGVLTSTEDGKYFVGEFSVPVAEKMEGHYGRLVLFQKAPPVDLSLQDLLTEVGDMATLLKALQREIS